MRFPTGIPLKLAFTALLALPALIIAQNLTSEQAFNAKRTLSIGVVLFPGFEPLDVYGPMELLVSLSTMVKMTVSFISFAPGPVNSRYTPFSATPGAPPSVFGYVLGTSTLATHAFADAPALDVILVPGGTGTRTLVEHRDDPARGSGVVEDFLRRRADQADYILGVCTGSALLARAGLLDGRRATTNKAAWGWVTGAGSDSNPNITWVPSARWTVDGKVWTSSGVAAGMDMAYAFARRAYGPGLADRAAEIMEYAPHQDPDWDPFSVVHQVPGANMSESLVSCVKPAGY
ncbi:class I glutamine amidotransferase-like protein [Apiospora marii]|uniref:Class I glutamine amidotransferase-like protein n=1 Tax=Apiospora marii TaxID=335849 RepID=A0ABR1RG01_9PEZI